LAIEAGVLAATERRIDMEACFDIARAKELDSRSSGGIEVRLLWDSLCDRLALEVTDNRCDERFVLAVEAADAFDAFNHPFAYSVLAT
jgi:hypothetical protein